MRSRLVGSGGDIAPVPSPVCVDEAPGLVQEFVGVGSEVVPLGLWIDILNRTWFLHCDESKNLLNEI